MDIYNGPRTLKADGHVIVLPDEFNGTLEEAGAVALEALKKIDVRTIAHDALSSSQQRAALESVPPMPAMPAAELAPEPRPAVVETVEIIDEAPPAPVVKDVTSEVLAAVRHDQLIRALARIQENTQRTAWNFPVSRDADGRITSIRAIPEAGG